MLARRNRLTRGAEYKAVVRRGRRCAAGATVTYVVASGDDRAARFGFIVSKQVGTAVVRNTVRRRLKAVSAEALDLVSAGSDVVIRALPGAVDAPYSQLRDEVHRCLRRESA